jgi:phosphatidylethanolamine-binding protein (PEBP) family uncharacterized protein
MYKNSESGLGSRTIRVRRSRGLVAVLAALIAVALSGCGSVAKQSAQKLVVVPLSSAAIHGSNLPALYTCDGKDIWPPLRWGALPPTVEEVVLFALGVTVLKNGRVLPRVEWAMAGLNPALHGVGAGQIPRGAFLLQGSNGKKRYSLCPAKGKTAHYGFALYALPRDTRATPKLEGEELLYNLTGPVVRDRAPAGGAFFATYTRK